VLSAEPQKASVVIKKLRYVVRFGKQKSLGFWLVWLVHVLKSSLVCFCENCLQKHQSTITIATIAEHQTQKSL
jgi:hypothetical protein